MIKEGKERERNIRQGERVGNGANGRGSLWTVEYVASEAGVDET